jgi:hypothetical protein
MIITSPTGVAIAAAIAVAVAAIFVYNIRRELKRD